MVRSREKIDSERGDRERGGGEREKKAAITTQEETKTNSQSTQHCRLTHSEYIGLLFSIVAFPMS